MKSIKHYIKRVIPTTLHFKLVDLKHRFTKFKQTHYSQNGEDIILNLVFPLHYKGFYVDVGAHHPYRISNTYLLYKKGWKGINIDANPQSIAMFKRERPHDINLNLGITGTTASLQYHRFSDPAVNTFSATEAERWKHKKWISYLGTVTVPTVPLVTVLNEQLPKNTAIDVLSIDVEGFDLAVLQSNDWEVYRPKVVVVEDHTFSFADMSNNSIYNYLLAQGYNLENKMMYTLFFKDTRGN